MTFPTGRTYKRTCVVCGKEFDAKSPRGKYCSAECKSDHKREENRLNNQKYRQSEEYCEKMREYQRQYRANKKAGVVVNEATCIICGKTFTRVKNGKYCSDECRAIGYARNRMEHDMRKVYTPVEKDYNQRVLTKYSPFFIRIWWEQGTSIKDLSLVYQVPQEQIEQIIEENPNVLETYARIYGEYPPKSVVIDHEKWAKKKALAEANAN